LLLWTIAPHGLPSVQFTLYFAAVGLPTIGFWRLIYTTLLQRLGAEHRVIIIGLGRPGQVIAELLEKVAHLNYQIVGYTSDADQLAELPSAPSTDGPSRTVLGTIADLPELIRNHHVNEVIVATNGDVSGTLFSHLVECQGQGVKISWMPDLYEKLCYSVPIEYIDPQWALFAMQGQPIFGRLQLTMKRVMDLLIMLLFLPTFLLLMPLLALLIRLDSPGPIFYRQVRAGRGGKLFSIWKFRTMVTDAEKDGKARWAAQNDDRITRVGRILRKARLDELPQLLNILRGEMSLVGPRPERPEFIEILQKEIPFYHTRLMVKPGLTGWAQVSYDYGNSTADAMLKLHYDFYYIRYWSLWLDIYILFKTIGIVFKLKGL
jgi:exopolysaccharide biosynthesis polyprenyl glycosylphosphotransferase